MSHKICSWTYILEEMLVEEDHADVEDKPKRKSEFSKPPVFRLPQRTYC